MTAGSYDPTTRARRGQSPSPRGGEPPCTEEIDLAEDYLRHLCRSGEDQRWVYNTVPSLKFKAKKWYGVDGREPYISNDAMKIAAERLGLERRVRGPDVCFLVPDPDRFAKATLEACIRRIKRRGDTLWPDWEAPKLRKVGRCWFAVHWKPVLAHEVTDRLEEARRHRPDADRDPRVQAIREFTYRASTLQT